MAGDAAANLLGGRQMTPRGAGDAGGAGGGIGRQQGRTQGSVVFLHATGVDVLQVHKTYR